MYASVRNVQDHAARLNLHPQIISDRSSVSPLLFGLRAAEEALFEAKEHAGVRLSSIVDAGPPEAMQPFTERFGELREISMEGRKVEGFQVMA